ncbi:hypothetical protein HYU19_00485 [Candidatus Woesearchaeota archaeon]|nr:hypothetical protein [Candidatus Woesearchaeota archaeon]
MSLSALYSTQISFTEWFERIGHSKTEAMRQEDNAKRDRLQRLQEIIGLPFDKPTSFLATELDKNDPSFSAFLQEHGQELCALRLMPFDASLPKLRMRGLTVHDVVETWYPRQGIDPSKYKADFVPHAEDTRWSTIFVVNKHGIFGEIIRGGHHHLTQGFYDSDKPILFSFDFREWRTDPLSKEAEAHLREVIEKLRVIEETKKAAIKNEFGASFFNDYLSGYFETTWNEGHGVWFIDYNRILGEMYSDVVPKLPPRSKNVELRGQVGNKGNVSGIARIITKENLSTAIVNDGDILICEMTTPDFVPLMKKAGAIVTDKGGILTHAAIVARELGKPCVVGVGRAVAAIQEGEMVEVDAMTGVVRRL